MKALTTAITTNSTAVPQRTPLRTSSSLITVLATMTTATPMATVITDAVALGRMREKMIVTSETRTIFSDSSVSQSRPAFACWTAITSSAETSEPWASTSNEKFQSDGGRRVTNQYRA